MTQVAPPPVQLQRLLDAESIAVVGASRDTRKVGSRPVEYLKRVGYRGRIYPINPTAAEIDGLVCFPSLSDLPEVPDLVAVVVAARRTREVVQEAADLGVPAVVVISSGFGEIDADGAAMEAELADIARSSGMVLVGPNSVGVIHTPNRLAVTFTEALSRGELTRSGGIGLVSQSGAFGTIIFALAREADLGIRTYVSTGNEAAMGLPDFLDRILDDPEIRVVGGYVEAVRDGPAFERMARKAADLDKPVVLVKVGSSDAGRTAASSHTGAIAGNDDVYQAIFDRHGIIRAVDEQHLLDVVDTFDVWYRLPRGRRVAVVSMSGGAGVLLCDDLDRRGLQLAPFSDELEAQLRRMLPEFASVRNPVDLTGAFVADNTGLRDVLVEIGGSEDVDAVLFFAGIGWTGGGGWAESVVEATPHGAPIMVVSQLVPDAARRTLRAAGIPVFESPIQASRTLASIIGWTTREAFAVPDVVADPPRLTHPRPDEAVAKALLEAVGVPVPAGRVVATPSEAAAVAADLGERVVVKAVGRGLDHKTEVGAVEISVPSASVADVARRMQGRIAELAPDAVVEGFLVEEVVPSGLDCVVGAVWEEPFGHLLMVGLGGTAVEVVGDVAFGVAPMGVEEADALIRRLKGFALLDGHRGAARLDVAAFAHAVSAISRLCASLGPDLLELDVNPLRVLPEGQGVVALDALVVGRSDNQPT